MSNSEHNGIDQSSPVNVASSSTAHHGDNETAGLVDHDTKDRQVGHDHVEHDNHVTYEHNELSHESHDGHDGHDHGDEHHGHAVPEPLGGHKDGEKVGEWLKNDLEQTKKDLHLGDYKK